MEKKIEVLKAKALEMKAKALVAKEAALSTAIAKGIELTERQLAALRKAAKSRQA